jgi:aminodeoxyfutalosine synthase
MDGTVVEEKIIHAAGAATDQIFHKDQIIHMITESGRTPVERDTLYEQVEELQVDVATKV